MSPALTDKRANESRQAAHLAIGGHGQHSVVLVPPVVRLPAQPVKVAGPRPVRPLPLPLLLLIGEQVRLVCVGWA